MLCLCYVFSQSSFLNSNISPGWQFSSRQMASRVEKRTALAFPVFRMERLAGVRSIRSASSVASAAKGLLEKDFITNDNGVYQVYDLFFKLWLQKTKL